MKLVVVKSSFPFYYRDLRYVKVIRNLSFVISY